MKKIFHQLLFASVVMFACVSQPLWAQNCCQKKIVFKGLEPLIDTTEFIKDGSALQDQSERFQKRVAFLDKDNLELQIQLLPMNVLLDSFYVKAKNAAATDTRCSDGKCLTGVRFTFGLENNKVILFYQPVYMLRTSTGKSSDFDAMDIDAQKYYRYNEATGEFQEADAKAYIKQYKKELRIRRFSDTSPYESYREEASSWRGDTRAIIFSFQELVEFYHLEFPEENDGKRYCGKLVIHNGAAMYVRSDVLIPGALRKRTKHTLFITKEGFRGVPGEKVLTTLKDNGANLAHLCPPSCTSLVYPMIQE